MNLLEAKAKFFDLQRVIDQKQVELQHLVKLRTELVGQIESFEKEAASFEVEPEHLEDSEPITA